MQASGRRAKTAEVTGIAETVDPPGGRVVGHGEDQLPDARPRHRAPLARRAERAWARSTSCSPRAGSASPRCGYGTIIGQGNGQGGREHGQKCDQLPGWRDIANPEHREYIAGVWGVDEKELPGPGVDCLRDVPQDRRRRDQGPALDLLQPEGLAAGQHLRHARAGEAGVLRRDRLLPERDRPPRRRRAARHRCRRRTRASSRRSRAGSSRSTRPSTAPARRRQDWRIIQDIAQRARPRRTASRSTSPREIFEELRRRQQGRRRRLLGHHLREDRAADGRLLAVLQRRPEDRRADPDHPGTPRLFEPGSWNPVAKGAGPFYFPDGKARFNVADVRAAGRGRRRRVPAHPDHRPRGQPVPLRHADAAHRPAGRPVPRAAHRDAPAAGREARHRRRRLGDRRDPPRRDHAARAGRHDDPPGHDLHPLPLGRARRARTS